MGSSRATEPVCGAEAQVNRRWGMFIVVQHQVTDPSAFWAGARESMGSIPSNLKLHQSLPAPDGSRAVCVWEAESVDAVKSYLESSAKGSRNEYYEVVNKEGVALPTGMAAKAGA
jgi:hypothetical protein